MPVSRLRDEKEPWREFSQWSMKEGTGEAGRAGLGLAHGNRFRALKHRAVSNSLLLGLG